MAKSRVAVQERRPKVGFDAYRFARLAGIFAIQRELIEEFGERTDHAHTHEIAEPRERFTHFARFVNEAAFARDREPDFPTRFLPHRPLGPVAVGFDPELIAASPELVLTGNRRQLQPSKQQRFPLGDDFVTAIRRCRVCGPRITDDLFRGGQRCRWIPEKDKSADTRRHGSAYANTRPFEPIAARHRLFRIANLPQHLRCIDGASYAVEVIAKDRIERVVVRFGHRIASSPR